MLGTGHRVQKLEHLLRTEHDRQALRPARHGEDIVETPRLLEGHGVQEAEGGHRHHDRLDREPPLRRQVQLIGANRFRPEIRGRLS